MSSPYNKKLSKLKAKRERKSRESFAKHFAEIKRRGKDKTPRVAPAPIEHLKRALTIHEYTAAVELVAAYKHTLGETLVRDVDYDAPVLAQVRFDGADEMAAKQSDLARSYQEWRTSLENNPCLAVAKDVLFAEIPLRQVDAKFKWRKGLARGYLGLALRHFASIRRNVPAGAHDWDLREKARQVA